MDDPEATIRELLEDAGRRPAVPAEDLAAIEAAARAEWLKLVAAERRRRLLPLALAASLILALAAVWWWKREGPPPAPEIVATIELLKGETGGMAVGQPLVSGSVVATASPALAALRFPDGKSVRLDAGTRVRLLSNRLELEAGAVYVDSRRQGSFEIKTALGIVHEMGTQFEVRLDQPGLRVRVREGAVSLDHDRGSDSISAGEELRVRHDGKLSRSKIDPHGPAWSWVLAAAPSLDIDGLTLGEYLDWVSRETALKVRYEDQTLAGLADTVRLRGSIEGLAPDESLSVILPGSGLGHRIERGTLLITKPGGR
jgi:ferric-dicitrate binding protein FerR (iron transport regulator)